jgi:hypothetical protein
MRFKRKIVVVVKKKVKSWFLEFELKYRDSMLTTLDLSMLTWGGIIILQQKHQGKSHCSRPYIFLSP